MHIVKDFSKNSTLKTVDYIDLNKYLGKWYEIARIDSWFEKGCVGATAEYSINDQTIIVHNSCRMNTLNGELKHAYGRASVVPNSNNAKLKVSFLPKILSIFDPLFSGDYWILKIDPQYKVVLVGAPSRKYLWILARSEEIDVETYNEYTQYAESIGFDITKLKR